MTNDATESVVAQTGQIYVAPYGATLPSIVDDSGLDVATTIDPDYVDTGYVTPDGVTIGQPRTIENLGAWQSFYPFRRIVTEKDFTLSFALRQWNTENLRLALGGADITSPAAGISVITPPPPEDILEYTLLLDFADGDKDYRFVLPRVMLTETQDIVLARTQNSDLAFTVGVMPDGVNDEWYLVTNDPNIEATS